MSTRFLAQGNAAAVAGHRSRTRTATTHIEVGTGTRVGRTLTRVAAIGYKEVELAFVGEFAMGFGRSPQEIQKVLRNNGLDGVSAHVTFESLGDRWPESVDTARTIGQKFLVVNSIDRPLRVQPGIWERASERLNRAGEMCRAAGLRLGYHNHLYEFADIQGTPKRPYDILLESTDPSLVSMQMDLCWFIAAGQDPVTYFKRHPGRYSSVHVKDLKRLLLGKEPIGLTTVSSELNRDLADVGQGVIDWPTTLAHCWSAGVRHYYVEHDSPDAPFESIQRSFGYLNEMRFNAAAREQGMEPTASNTPRLMPKPLPRYGRRLIRFDG